VRNPSLWAGLLGVDGAIVEGVEMAGDELVVRVRLRRGKSRFCGVCGKRSRLYDKGEGRRRWRALDLGSTKCYLEAEAPRVDCREHGVRVVQVTWADHDARTTRSFDDQVGWLAVHCNRSAVSELMRVSWRTVGWILARVSDRLRRDTDQLAGLCRIGIDEISFRRGHKYLIVVVDLDTGRLVWAAEGRDDKTLRKFFIELGEERCALITHVSADAGSWIPPAVQFSCPNAVRCMDPFHVVQWATQALDEVRSEVWRAARRDGNKQDATDIRRARWALWKGGDNLSDSQQAKLDWIEKTNEPLYRAYLLKEQLRLVFQLPGEQGLTLLDEWIEWAENSGLKPFARVAGTINFHRRAIQNALTHGISNAKTEGLNTRIRLLTRRSFGFHSAAPLIGLAMLCFGGFRPRLPGRG